MLEILSVPRNNFLKTPKKDFPLPEDVVRQQQRENRGREYYVMCPRRETNKKLPTEG